MADEARIAAEARASAAEAECARLRGEQTKESQPPLKPVQIGASPQYDPCTGQVFCTACRVLGRPNATMTLDYFPSLDETLFRCPCGHTEHAHGKVSIVPAKDGKGFESVTEEYSKSEIPAPSLVIA